MAEKFPWSDPQLFALQSPLFRADKIHTPLLLTHGSSDTNVPVGESIQMFTALKSLGRDVAFVQVRSEDHVIIEAAAKDFAPLMRLKMDADQAFLRMAYQRTHLGETDDSFVAASFCSGWGRSTTAPAVTRCSRASTSST